MNKTVSEKMGVKKGIRVFLKNAPGNFEEEVGLPEIELINRLTGEFDYIHFFVGSQKEFHKDFEKLTTHLAKTGMLWVSWPKSGQKQTDLNIKNVIKMGYDYGLVESKAISINATWSALKFTHPKEGKEYNNSYGKLPDKS